MLKVIYNAITDTVKEFVENFAFGLIKWIVWLFAKGGKIVGKYVKSVAVEMAEINKKIDWNLEAKQQTVVSVEGADKAKEEVDKLTATIKANEAEMLAAKAASEELGRKMAELADIYSLSQEGLDIMYHEHYERQKQELIASYESRKNTVREAEDSMFNFGA